MKLVYLMRFWPTFGGGETVTRALANEMIKRGHDVSIIYFWDNDGGINNYVSKQINLFKIEGISCINGSELSRKEYPYLEKELRKTFLQINPDVIINQWMPTKQVARAMNRDKTVLIKCHHGAVKYVPVIKTIKQKLFYGLLGNWAGWIRVLPEYGRDAYYADKWVLLSESLMNDGKKLLPFINDDRFEVVSNPLPYSVDGNSINLEKKEKIVIFVGRIVELKRVPLLLDAWSKIEKYYPDWKFQIIGDGPHLDKCKNKAETLQLKNVSFIGYADAKKYMEKASILVMASNQEGFPMVLIEAEQSGVVPVAIDSFPAASDIIINGKNGVLVNENDFAIQLSRIMNDDEQRMIMAKCAINDSKKYDIHTICDQWESIFIELKELKYVKSN